MNDNELETLLCSGKGVLLDGGAAKIICERNFGAEIGLFDIAEPHKLQYYSTAAAEEFFNPRYGGGDKVFVQAYVPVYGNGNSYSALTLADGAEAVSALCDYDANRLFIAGSMFVNSSGTRIFVHSMYWDESGACADIFSYNRVEMFRNVIKFLAGNTPVPMVIGDCPYNLMLMQKMPDDSMVAGVFNLSSDVCQQIELTIGKRTEFSFAEMLIDGKWCPVDILRSEDDILKAVVMCRSNLYAGMFFRFRR